MVTEQEVLCVLQDVTDHDTGKKVADIGKLSVTINKSDLGIILHVSEPKSALWEQQFKDNCSTIIKSKIPGISSITVALVMAKQQSNVPKRVKLKGIKNVLLVSSGKGGVGKSTVAAQLALTLSALGYKVALVDADIYGPSIPRLLGIGVLAEVDNDGMMIPVEMHGLQSISIGNIIEDQDKALVWRGPMLTKAINKLIMGTRWAARDYMIIDTPPGTGDVHISLTQGYSITGAVVVSTPHELSVIHAMKTCDMLKSLDVKLLGIVENMSYFLDVDTGKKTHLFGEGGGQEIAERADSTLLGMVSIHPKIHLPSVNKRLSPLDNEFCNAYEKIVANIIRSISS
ncbi:ATPase [Anaplasma phagocytophilum str. MRK]|nr:ATPase [Anaplasma phagocytophilum str. MRK]